MLSGLYCTNTVYKLYNERRGGEDAILSDPTRTGTGGQVGSVTAN